jgi:hypothetical protein
MKTCMGIDQHNTSKYNRRLVFTSRYNRRLVLTQSFIQVLTCKANQAFQEVWITRMHV